MTIARTIAAVAPGPLRGPEFGSYAADDVAWLLTDISGHALERPAAERYAAIADGRGHYSESLPVEYAPSATYLDAFERALFDRTQATADAVATLAHVIAHRGRSNVVLASLARAGTPVGILLRRYAATMLGTDWPHFTLSIVHDIGIDAAALAYLARHHDPRDIVFVDGWTGKGAIAKTLANSLAGAWEARGFHAGLAVLADPARCAPLYGTRDDVLIASACLNSTVSGLVSRTVVRPDLTGPGFHGAKFYAELADSDRSAQFLDTITAAFPTSTVSTAPLDPPDWAGMASVQTLADALGISNTNLIKPGVGETTRGLLRRVPDRVLIKLDGSADLTHILELAAERGVPINSWPNLAYSCVGIAAEVRSNS